MQPPGPDELAALYARFAQEARGPRPDVSELCLLIGAMMDGALDEQGRDEVQIELDRLAGSLPHRPGGPTEWAAALERLLGHREGFGGTAADYKYLESSLLHQVLRRRRGLPILLSVVWTEVARRAGGAVHGVALPGHFVVGFGPLPGQDPQGDGDRPLLADPFAGGRVLGEAEADQLVSAATGRPPERAVFLPADPLDVVRRVLNNIRAWASGRHDRSDTALTATDAALLLPAHPAELRRERGRILVSRGAFLDGARELEEWAEAVAPADEAASEEARAQARAARSMLN